MSGLWDYDDDDDLQDADAFLPPEQPIAVVEDDYQEEKASHKRKPGRKPAKAGGGRSKRRAGSPLTTDLLLRPPQQPMPILLLSSDDEDDIALLPAVDPARGGVAGVSGVTSPGLAAARAQAAARKPAAPAIDPATQKALAQEQELLTALRQVTAMQQNENNDDDDVTELEPLLSITSRPPLGSHRFTDRVAAQQSLGAAGGAGLISGPGEGEASVHEAGASGSGTGIGSTDGPADAAAPKVPAEDRVVLKLCWQHGKDGHGKDGHLMMRVVKTDPISKMVEKFRQIAQQRMLSKDPNKIKFLFDGDDLSKMPNTTPEELDLEDDMIIDIKL